jgi:hypothetical protein
MFLEIEVGLGALALVLAFLAPNLGTHCFEALERTLGKLAGRRSLSVLVAGLTALALRIALLPVLPVQHPAGMDDFGYRLLSDTFAHGRLTNPTNPMWMHFESFHIIWQPTYTAMFYPAQGLIMALGQVLTGRPFWGVWLSVGLMCAAITWMLQVWVGEGWALLGGFLVAIRFGTFGYWANSYAGGAVAAIGGALVLGALPRIKRDRRVRDALLMGLGFAILANSRPYEGLFFGISVAVALLVWIWKKELLDRAFAFRRVITPLLALLLLTVVAMGYYNWRTTGSPFNTPYLVDAHTYNPVPYFPWQPLKPVPMYHHALFRKFYIDTFSLPTYEAARTIKGLLSMKFIYTTEFWSFFLGPVLTLPLLLVCFTLPYGFSWKGINPETRFLLIVLGVTVVGESLPIYFSPHYAAPLTAVIVAMVLIAMRRVKVWHWRGSPTGRFITRAVPSICILLLGLRCVAGPLRIPGPAPWPGQPFPIWCSPGPSIYGRTVVLQQLRQDPGRQLVIVHYNPDHPIAQHEWVYNRADIDSAKVIWARDMGPAKNEELIQYFKNRHAWLVDADGHPPRLRPYSDAEDRQAAAAASQLP